MMDWLTTGVGVAAGICSTASFTPQVVKTWREGDTKAISLPMYVVTVAAFSLWIAYGWVLGSIPIIVFNTLSLVLSASILIMKLRNFSRDHDTAET
jgi:MtN3 and saliva related transmembrane protein